MCWRSRYTSVLGGSLHFVRQSAFSSGAGTQRGLQAPIFSSITFHATSSLFCLAGKTPGKNVGTSIGDIDSLCCNLSGTCTEEERAIVPPLMRHAPGHVSLKTWQAWLLALVISVPMFICKYENYLREFLGNYLREYLFALVRKAASEVCQALLLTQELPQLVAQKLPHRIHIFTVRLNMQ
jgi:hypothetical protein